MTLSRLVLLSVCLLALAACERLGIPDPAKEAAAREAEGRAIGGACRQSGRALEDCYTLNQGALKAAVFEGWREMNDYMIQNKLEAVKPEFPMPGVLMPKRRVEAESAPVAEAAASAPAEDNMTPAERRRARIEERRQRAEAAAAAAASRPEAPAAK